MLNKSIIVLLMMTGAALADPRGTKVKPPVLPADAAQLSQIIDLSAELAGQGETNAALFSAAAETNAAQFAAVGTSIDTLSNTVSQIKTKLVYVAPDPAIPEWGLTIENGTQPILYALPAGEPAEDIESVVLRAIASSDNYLGSSIAIVYPNGWTNIIASCEPYGLSETTITVPLLNSTNMTFVRKTGTGAADASVTIAGYFKKTAE